MSPEFYVIIKDTKNFINSKTYFLLNASNQEIIMITT